MKISKIFLLLVILGFFTLAASALAASALAATGDYVPLVQIPGIPAGANFLQYLSGIYNFLISIVGILAMASLVYGGFRYLTSVGNPAAVEDAKDIINSAIIGLVLALSSWLILNEINPDVLVTSRKPGGGMDALRDLKYAYKPVNRACVAGTNFDGVQVTGTNNLKCQCADDKEVTATKIGSKTSKIINLSVAPATPVTGIGYTINGNLVDAETNAPLASEKVKVNIRKADMSSSLIANNQTTDLAGSFGFLLSSGVSCAGNHTIEAVFVGNAAYASSNAALNYNITGTACDYPVKPGVSISSSDESFCQRACSDPNVAEDKQYHCAKAVLLAGKTPDSLSHNDVSIKVNETVYFDARTQSVDYSYPGLNIKVSPSTDGKFKNGIDGYIINPDTTASGSPPAWDNSISAETLVLSYDYADYESTNCSTLLGIASKIVDIFRGPGVSSKGITYYKFTSTGDYKAVLNVYTTKCTGPFIDRIFIHVAP